MVKEFQLEFTKKKKKSVIKTLLSQTYGLTVSSKLGRENGR